MASIKERKNSFSVIYWYTDKDGRRKQKWDTLRTKKEAKTRKSYVELYQSKHGTVLVPNESSSEAKKESPVTPIAPRREEREEMTLRELLAVFVDVYGTVTWSPSTYSGKVGVITNYINPYIGDWKLSEITTQRLSAYYNDMLSVPEVATPTYKRDRCVSPAGVKKIHDVIRCALNQAIRWDYFDQNKRNPALLATLPKYRKVKRKVWSIDTFRKALAVSDDGILSLCMNLAFSCSMRVGEIGALTWSDVVIDSESIKNGNARVIIDKELTRVSAEALDKLKQTDVIKVFPCLKPHCTTRLVLKSPKTESSNRTVWLPRTVAEMLVTHRRTQEELKEFIGEEYNDYGLVIAQDNGNPLESRIIRKRFKRLCDENGFEDVVFHSLRHLSTGYKLKMTGGDVKSVQGDTGHAEAEMVMDVYSEIIDANRKENARMMDEAFYKPITQKCGLRPQMEVPFVGEVTEKDLALLRFLKSIPSGWLENFANK